MTFEELIMVVDPNADLGEILELEFEGNDKFNRVRSDCVDILHPLFGYQVDSIGVSEDGNLRIWLDQPMTGVNSLTECIACKHWELGCELPEGICEPDPITEVERSE